MSKKQILISESEKKSILLQHVSKGYKTIIMEGDSTFTVTVAIKTDLPDEYIQTLKSILELEFYICDSGNCKRKGYIKCNETKTFSAEKKIFGVVVSAKVKIHWSLSASHRAETGRRVVELPPSIAPLRESPTEIIKTGTSPNKGLLSRPKTNLGGLVLLIVM